MITFDDAKTRAEELLDVEVRPWVDDEVVIDASATVRAESYWVFFYNTRAYFETRSMVNALAGNGPVIVSAHDGRAMMALCEVPQGCSLKVLTRVWVSG